MRAPPMGVLSRAAVILGLAHLAIEVDDVDRSARMLSTIGWRLTVVEHGMQLPPEGAGAYPSDAAAVDLAILATGETTVPVELTRHVSDTRPEGHYTLVLGRDWSADDAAPPDGDSDGVAGALSGSQLLTAPRRVEVRELGAVAWVGARVGAALRTLSIVQVVRDTTEVAAFWRSFARARLLAEGDGWSRLRFSTPLREATADLLLVSAGDQERDTNHGRIDGRGAAALALVSTDVVGDLRTAEAAGASVLAPAGTVSVAGRRLQVGFLEPPGGGCVELVCP